MPNEVFDGEDDTAVEFLPRRGGKKADSSDMFNRLTNVPVCVKYKKRPFRNKAEA